MVNADVGRPDRDANRERHSHQQGWRKNCGDARGHQWPDIGERRTGEDRAGPQVNRPGATHQPHRNDRRERQQKLEHREHCDETSTAAREKCRHPTANRDAGQHRREHNRKGVSGRAEQDNQHPKPDDLEPERDEPGDCKRQEHEPQSPRRFGRGHRRRRSDSSRIGRRRARPISPSRENERASGDGQIDQRGNSERPRDAKLRNHPDAGEQSANNRPGGVPRVEPRHLPPENRAVRKRGFDDEWQSRAHQGCRDDQDRKNDKTNRTRPTAGGQSSSVPYSRT